MERETQSSIPVCLSLYVRRRCDCPFSNQAETFNAAPPTNSWLERHSRSWRFLLKLDCPCTRSLSLLQFHRLRCQQPDCGNLVSALFSSLGIVLRTGSASKRSTTLQPPISRGFVQLLRRILHIVSLWQLGTSVRVRHVIGLECTREARFVLDYGGGCPHRYS